VLLALVAGGALRAEEPAHAPGTDEPPPDLGIKLAAVPIVGYGSDEGFGFGAHFKFTDFGVGTRKPFVYSLEGNAFTSSKGIKSYWVAVDVPEFAGSPYRVTLRTAYSQSRFQPYYGLGNGSVRDPDATRCPTEVLEAQLPGAPNTCPAGGGQPANPAFRGFRFYEYDLLSFPSLQLTVLRSLGGPWSVLVGYQFLFAGFQPTYSPDDLGQNTGSQLSIDAAAGRLVGWNGRPVGNAELRWRFVNVGEFELGTVLALDAGRVWARLGDSDVGTIHVGGAAGLRIAWSHHLIIRVDFGLAPELQFHLDFGELF